MRTPKYKAFYKPHNYIYHVTDMNFEGPDYTLREVKLSNGIWLRSDKLDDIILIEQTPFTDKNGEEIYEGDIFKSILNSLGNELINPKLVYEELRWILKDSSKNRNFEYLDYYEADTELEVIGNIYKNPELISKTPTHEQ